MAALQELLDRIVREGGLPFEGLGELVAIGLIVAMRLLLRGPERRFLRGPLRLLLAHLAFVALALASPTGSGLQKFGQLGGLLALVVCIGRAGFVLVLDSVLGRRIARPIPKIFRDILEGLVYTAAVLVTLRAAGAELDALLTTSALLTAVVGLSMQDTLGNLFAGLSLQAQQPFIVGDWIQYGDETKTIGRVVEINWRATKVITLDEVEIVIPNGPLAKAPIQNFTRMGGSSRRSIHVVAPLDVAPRRVHDVILEAIAHVDGVLPDPAPTVVTQEFTERGVKYWLRYYPRDFVAREDVDGRVRDRIWYALYRAGIPIAIPVHDVAVHQVQEERAARALSALERRRAALERVDFCRALDPDQREELASAAHDRLYGPGEYVIREGEQGSEFFIVERGELAVTLSQGNGSPVEVARLRAGSFFGEMSAMTGEPRSATVRTATDCELLVLDKPAFQRLLVASPRTAERISEVLADRQGQLDSATSKPSSVKIHLDRAGERTGQLLGKIRSFFSL